MTVHIEKRQVALNVLDYTRRTTTAATTTTTTTTAETTSATPISLTVSTSSQPSATSATATFTAVSSSHSGLLQYFCLTCVELHCINPCSLEQRALRVCSIIAFNGCLDNIRRAIDGMPSGL